MMLAPASSASIPHVIAEQVITIRMGNSCPKLPAMPVERRVPAVVIEDDAAKTLPRSASEV